MMWYVWMGVKVCGAVVCAYFAYKILAAAYRKLSPRIKRLFNRIKQKLKGDDRSPIKAKYKEVEEEMKDVTVNPDEFYVSTPAASINKIKLIEPITIRIEVVIAEGKRNYNHMITNVLPSLRIRQAKYYEYYLQRLAAIKQQYRLDVGDEKPLANQGFFLKKNKLKAPVTMDPGLPLRKGYGLEPGIDNFSEGSAVSSLYSHNLYFLDLNREIHYYTKCVTKFFYTHFGKHIGQTIIDKIKQKAFDAADANKDTKGFWFIDIMYNELTKYVGEVEGRKEKFKLFTEMFKYLQIINDEQNTSLMKNFIPVEKLRHLRTIDIMALVLSSPDKAMAMADEYDGFNDIFEEHTKYDEAFFKTYYEWCVVMNYKVERRNKIIEEARTRNEEPNLESTITELPADYVYPYEYEPGKFAQINPRDPVMLGSISYSKVYLLAEIFDTNFEDILLASFKNNSCRIEDHNKCNGYFLDKMTPRELQRTHLYRLGEMAIGNYRYQDKLNNCKFDEVAKYEMQFVVDESQLHRICMNFAILDDIYKHGRYGGAATGRIDWNIKVGFLESSLYAPTLNTVHEGDEVLPNRYQYELEKGYIGFFKILPRQNLVSRIEILKEVAINWTKNEWTDERPHRGTMYMKDITFLTTVFDCAVHAIRLAKQQGYSEEDLNKMREFYKEMLFKSFKPRFASSSTVCNMYLERLIKKDGINEDLTNVVFDVEFNAAEKDLKHNIQMLSRVMSLNPHGVKLIYDFVTQRGHFTEKEISKIKRSKLFRTIEVDSLFDYEPDIVIPDIFGVNLARLEAEKENSPAFKYTPSGYAESLHILFNEKFLPSLHLDKEKLNEIIGYGVSYSKDAVFRGASNETLDRIGFTGITNMTGSYFNSAQLGRFGKYSLLNLMISSSIASNNQELLDKLLTYSTNKNRDLAHIFNFDALLIRAIKHKDYAGFWKMGAKIIEVHGGQDSHPTCGAYILATIREGLDYAIPSDDVESFSFLMDLMHKGSYHQIMRRAPMSICFMDSREEVQNADLTKFAEIIADDIVTHNKPKALYMLLTEYPEYIDAVKARIKSKLTPEHVELLNVIARAESIADLEPKHALEMLIKEGYRPEVSMLLLSHRLDHTQFFHNCYRIFDGVLSGKIATISFAETAASTMLHRMDNLDLSSSDGKEQYKHAVSLIKNLKLMYRQNIQATRLFDNVLATMDEKVKTKLKKEEIAEEKSKLGDFFAPLLHKFGIQQPKKATLVQPEVYEEFLSARITNQLAIVIEPFDLRVDIQFNTQGQTSLREREEARRKALIAQNVN